MKYFFLLLLPIFSLNAQSYVDWSNTKLTYENFKKKPLQTKTPQGELDSRLGWQIAEADGELPELYVYNRFDENNSWISMKHDEILKNMQLQFDLSELYARKIRKEFEDLKKKKEIKKEIYKAKFNNLQKNFEKRLNSIANVTVNQPSFYKILNNEIQDSLNLYKSYEIKK
ncbi:hypothetical protein [Chishuiella sp.]|uniref:hypothetical protein n=1 Tax=Chishuiella sp. TaxID=1969467 RepID=UPI0028B25CD2|nr:hypothetical protein [Chishuiella sp.]